MKKKITAILIVLCLVCMLAPTAFADGDTTPPRLISISVDKTSYVSGESVTITLEAVDDESGMGTGIDVPSIRIRKVKDNRYEYLSMHMTKIENTNQYRCIFEVNKYFGTGQYYIFEVWLRDNAKNVSTYENGSANSESEGTFKTTYFSVTNTVRTDWDPPIIKSVSIDKPIANVGDTVTFDIRAEDPAGLQYACAYLVYEGMEFPSSGFELLPVAGSPGLLRGSIIVTNDMPDATYFINDFWAVDGLGNGGAICDASLFRNATFKINNPNLKPNLPDPIITKITLTQNTLKPGDPINVKVEVNPNGMRLNEYAVLYLSNDKSGTSCDLSMLPDGTYVSNSVIDAKMQAGTYKLRVYMWRLDGKHVQYFGQCGNYIFPEVKIISAFSGVDNVSLPVGSVPFDPKAGVSASNQSEGDLTSKIEVTGNVDTNTPGLYLLKYKIKSNQSYNMEDGTYYAYYYESRWIGVSEMPSNPSSDPGAPLAVTNDSLAIGASSNDVSIKKDGKAINFANKVSAAGEYTVSLKGTSGNSGSYGASAYNSDTAKAVIDRSGPVISASSKSIAPNNYKVIVNAKDPAGVAETRYIQGSGTLANCKAYGKAFSGTFNVGAKGKYTIYAKDRFGYESVKVIDISKILVSNPYLNKISVDKGKLNRTFKYNYYSYTIKLGEHEDGVTIAPVKADPDATMTIQGKAVASKYIHVDNNKSVKVPIRIKSGKLSKTYTVTVKRAPSTNNNLTGLTVSVNSEWLTYNPATLTYTLQLDKDTRSVRVTPIKASSLAKVYPGAKTYTLKNGKQTKIRITVTAQSGAKKKYWLIIKRASS